MGCDIHCAIEYKKNGYSGWNTLYSAVFGLPRFYNIFSKLAGVRNGLGITPIDSPRGIPLDADDYSMRSLSNEDYHSASWCTGDEFKRIFTDSDMEIEKHDAPEYWCIYKTMRNLEKLGYETRLIFNFDS